MKYALVVFVMCSAVLAGESAADLERYAQQVERFNKEQVFLRNEVTRKDKRFANGGEYAQQFQDYLNANNEILLHAASNGLNVYEVAANYVLVKEQQKTIETLREYAAMLVDKRNITPRDSQGRPIIAEDGSFKGEISKNTGQVKDVYVPAYWRSKAEEKTESEKQLDTIEKAFVAFYNFYPEYLTDKKKAAIMDEILAEPFWRDAVKKNPALALRYVAEKVESEIKK